MEEAEEEVEEVEEEVEEEAGVEAEEEVEEEAEVAAEDEEVEEVEEEDDDDDDPLATFRTVLETMDLDTLPAYASSLRRSEAGVSSNEAAEFECTVDFKLMMGSFHVLFPVVFNDGVKWLFKVPSAGYAGLWDDSAARSLKSEALTMRMLQLKTSIPVPTVHKYDSSLDNEFKCPFILMDFLNGKPLYESKHLT